LDIWAIRFAQLAICFWFLACNENAKDTFEPKFQLSQENEAELEIGDILLRRGEGRVSEFILLGLQEDIPISHCGFLIPADVFKSKGIDSDVPGDSFKNWGVIHAVSSGVSNFDGMQCCSLEAFLHHASNDSIYVSHCIGIKTHHQLRLTNSLFEIFTARVPFDHGFLPDDHNEIYCSELMLMLLEEDLGLVKLKRDALKPMSHSLGFSWAFDSTQFEIAQYKRQLIDSSAH
jgi:hypothetical protein